LFQEEAVGRHSAHYRVLANDGTKTWGILSLSSRFCFFAVANNVLWTALVLVSQIENVSEADNSSG
jgi:hypothetical protein